MMRLLLFGDIDLNLIDGSAVWLASLAEVLGGIEDLQVSILLKTPITRETIVREAARLPRIRFLDPWKWTRAADLPASLPTPLPKGRLSPASAASLIQALDQVAPYDIVLVRGMDTLRSLLDQPDTADRVWAYVTNPLQYDTPAGRVELQTLRTRFARILCQTDEAKAVVLQLSGRVNPDQILILAPMISDLPPMTTRVPDPVAPRLGYSGKFSNPYRIFEMLEAFEAIRSEMPGAEFHIVGDKIHNAPPQPGFADRVRHRLENTPGVIWHGGVSRHQANVILSGVDIAASWRTADFDASVELSTKVLEYSALGLPVLMNPSPIQRRLFGPDYPAYVSTSTEFVDRFRALVKDPNLYRAISKHVHSVAGSHSFESHRARLLPVLFPAARCTTLEADRPTLLWVGHDFKFLDPIRTWVEAPGLYQSLTDRQPGHVIQDAARSHSLLRQADLIFCEWCLGNAEWYSHHKQPHQRLVVRLHRQEIELPYLERIRWSNVDRIVFISDWLQEEFCSRFPQMADRTLLVYNAVECFSLDLEKLPETQWNIGLLGFCPKLKDPRLAVAILHELKRRDQRYTLFIKGKTAREISWLWRRPDERKYYEQLEELINSSPYANSVVFEPHGDDVGAWFSKMGFILSTSDNEGSHQAVAEGMAAGTIPVIRNWRGADRLYPDKYVFSHVRQAVDAIRHWSSSPRYETEAAYCREFAKRFDLPRIAARYQSLFLELLRTRTPGSQPRGTAPPAPYKATDRAAQKSSN